MASNTTKYPPGSTCESLVDQKIDELDRALENVDYSGPVKELIDTAKEFCDRVEKGRVRSKYTYRKFKSILAKL